MIAEGPTPIEPLPSELQQALDAALRPGEQVRIAVRGDRRSALAATGERLLLLRQAGVTEPVEVRATPLACVTRLETEARTVGGRLVWCAGEEELAIEYPGFDAGKYNLVSQRLQAMISERHTPAPDAGPQRRPEVARERACPQCGVAMPAEGCWCPACGVQAADPCWECGRPLPPGARFCSFCGTAATEPAVAVCRSCRAMVARGQVYCPACGEQARLACRECERPMRRDWKHCPTCGGAPEWSEAGVGEEPARLHGEPDDPGAWLPPASQARDAAALNDAGTRAYDAEEYQDAVRLFRQATEADPGNAGYWTNLGVAYGQVGDDLQAFEAYRRAVALDEGEVSAYLYMGQLYLERERYAEAREMWERVIAIDPACEEAEEAREYLRGLEEV